jgi:hypothetical protein
MKVGMMECANVVFLCITNMCARDNSATATAAHAPKPLNHGNRRSIKRTARVCVEWTEHLVVVAVRDLDRCCEQGGIDRPGCIRGNTGERRKGRSKS